MSYTSQERWAFISTLTNVYTITEQALDSKTLTLLPEAVAMELGDLVGTSFDEDELWMIVLGRVMGRARELGHPMTEREAGYLMGAAVGTLHLQHMGKLPA